MLRKPKVPFIEPLLTSAMVIDRHLDSFMKEKTPYGLSQIKILLSIERAHQLKKSIDCTQSAVARLWGVSEAAISRQVVFLEKERLITRGSDPNEKRKVVLKPTAKGRRLIEKSTSLMDKELLRIFKPMSDRMKDLLTQQLKNTLESLSQNTNHYEITQNNTK